MVLIASTMYALQKMVDLCALECKCIDMVFNTSKSVVMRIGKRFKSQCEDIQLYGKSLAFVSRAKYLGVNIVARLKFRTSLHERKSNFFSSFNSIYRRCSSANPETVIMTLISSYCKPYLLYGVEALNLCQSMIRSLASAWNYAVSKIFKVKYKEVDFICNIFDDMPFYNEVLRRQRKFMCKLMCSNNVVINAIFDISGSRELLCLDG